MYMPQALVLINTDVGAEQEVLNKLLSIEGVKEAYLVYGIYDILAKIEVDSLDKLKNTIMVQIRKISKVRSTLSMIVVESFERS